MIIPECVFSMTHLVNLSFNLCSSCSSNERERKINSKISQLIHLTSLSIYHSGLTGIFYMNFILMID